VFQQPVQSQNCDEALAFVRLYVGGMKVPIGGNVRFSRLEDVLHLGLGFLPC
jgi:hypothetical protein